MQTLPIKQQILCRHADIRLRIPVLTGCTCSKVCHEAQELLLKLQLTHPLTSAAVITQDVDCLMVIKSVSVVAIDCCAVGPFGMEKTGRKVRQLDSQFAYLSIATDEVVQARWHQRDA